jgi:hypothetical protein
VKFARDEPTEPELRGLLDAALRLIDETREIVGIDPSLSSSDGPTPLVAPKSPPPLPKEVAK